MVTENYDFKEHGYSLSLFHKQYAWRGSLETGLLMVKLNVGKAEHYGFRVHWLL